LVVDDHELFRAGVRDLLETHGFEVVADAADGEAAVRLCDEHAPEVVVMDLNMPGVGGVEATHAIREATPNARILMLAV
jgi:two-component system invasion response regulator UvrY